MKRAFLAIVFAACGTTLQPSAEFVTFDGDEPDLPLGTVEGADTSSTNWGSALICKSIPEVSPLVSPRLILSIDGMSVHLIDEATGYDRVFPAGVGKIENEESDSSYQESLSYFPILALKRNDFAVKSSTNTQCKKWWTDSATGERSPVFAGLPFMPFYGGYALHGPIDNYTAPNGGYLTRGYVSHGCFRMEAADIVEIYGRIGKLPSVPVRLQREPERTSEGAKVDPTRWVGSECRSDLDCNYDGGFCHVNTIGDRGFCSARCTKSCADRAASPATFCVQDPDSSTLGMCVPKVTDKNDACRPYDHLQPKTMGRFNQASVTAKVCVPGTRGWVGDRCTDSTQCVAGRCDAGVCTQDCTKACPDMPGTPWTTCAREPSTRVLSCERQCTLASNASECAAGTACVERTRAAGDTRTVCAR